MIINSLLMDELVDLIDDIKRDIPDQKYIDIMKALSTLHNQRQNHSNVIVYGIMTVEIEDIRFGRGADIGLVLKWKDEDGHLHRDQDQPAEIVYSATGKTIYEQWYKHGRHHRDNDQPAQVEYLETGQVLLETWYKDDRLHRDTGQPAEVRYSETGQVLYERWYKDGQMHRDTDQPAEIRYSGKGQVILEAWYKDGYLHRDTDQPAFIQYEPKRVRYMV